MTGSIILQTRNNITIVNQTSRKKMLLELLFNTFLFYSNYALAVSADTCAMIHPTEYLGRGFAIRAKTISANDTIPVTPGELDENFQSMMRSKIGFMAPDIYNATFDLRNAVKGDPNYEYLFPDLVTKARSNFAAMYYAILVPPETGEYIFAVSEVSDGAAMYILDDRDTYCCEDMLFYEDEDFRKSSHFYYIPDDPEYQTNSIKVHLEEGMLNYIVFSYVSHGSVAVFRPSITTPSGRVLTDYKGIIYSDITQYTCKIANVTSSLTSQWTDTYTTTYSTATITTKKTGSLGIPYTEIDTFYYVLTPSATPSSSLFVSSSTIPSSVYTSTSVLTSLSSEELSTSSVAVSSSEGSPTSSILSSRSKESSTSSVVGLSSEGSSTIASLGSSTIFSSGSATVSQIPSYSGQSSIVHSSIVSSLSTNSSLVSSKEQSNEISSTFSSVITSSRTIYSSHSSFSGINDNTATKPETEPKSSATSNVRESNSISNWTSSATSLINSFTIVSSDKSTIETSSSCSSTKLIQSGSSQDKSGETGRPLSKDTISTSIYTDVYGMTRTATVRCSTTSNDAKSDVKGDSEGTNLTTLTTNIDNNGVEYISTVTNNNNASPKYQGTGKIKEDHSTMTTEVPNHVSSVIVQLQSSDSSTTIPINIQQAPNAANKYTVGLFFSVISFSFQLFFI